MTPEQEQHVRSILTLFYPNSPPNVINQELAEFAAKILAQAVQASSAFNWVPRPPMGAPGLLWLCSQPLMGAWRSNQGRLSQTMVSGVALKFRGEYETLKQTAY